MVKCVLHRRALDLAAQLFSQFIGRVDLGHALIAFVHHGTQKDTLQDVLGIGYRPDTRLNKLA